MVYCYIHNISIWLIDGTLEGTTIEGQSGSESNSNERVFNISRSSKTEASLFDAILSHIQNTRILFEP